MPTQSIGKAKVRIVPTLDTIIPKPSTRIFILGTTGSGKSTLLSRLAERYHQNHPSHRIYLVDPKRRFFPIPDKEETRLFPDGTMATLHGNRWGVSVNAHLIHDVDGFRYKREWAWVVQEHAKTLELFEWLYLHPDAQRPCVVILDESFDFFPGVRADPRLRKLLQQGRELSIGTWVINQRPAWIDQTLFSETERMYVGRLYIEDDLKRVYKNNPLSKPQRDSLLVPLPKFTWYMIDKLDPERSFKFTLKEEE